MRIEAVFRKGRRLRHIGHLDIQRAFMRAFRRSGLPVSYSNGFNPHILVTFASALSVGAIGERELMEVKLDSPVSPEEFVARMNHALPEELQLREAKELEERHPALMAMVCAAAYEIHIEDGDAAALTGAVPALLAREHVSAERKTKSGVKEVDIRPLILSLSAKDGETLSATLVLTEAEACKPDMLLGALAAQVGCELPRVQVTRKGLLGRDENGSIQPLETL